jgi:mono/diheme cytochrome c family protein
VLRLIALGALGLMVVFLSSCARPSVAEGRSLYNANGCSGCHGRDGHGDGPLAKNLPSDPIDLSDVTLFKRGTSEDAIAETLKVGISRTHSVPALKLTHHELLMPGFDHLTKTERRSIALYVISLRTAS